jgi:hypothetical protein
MGLDVNAAEIEKAVVTLEQDAELMKMKYAHVHSSEKKKNKGSKLEVTIPDSDVLASAKSNYKKALKAIKAAKLTVTMEGERHSSSTEISSPTKLGSHGKKTSRHK